MLQLLLVDDEAHWVDNMAETKPWHELGISTVHKAYSGAEALEKIDLHTIDIVITDLVMPGMTGIELIGRIQAERQGIKCIVLSGYAEFEYAQQAMKLQAFDYLLKPVRTEELMAAVRKAAEELREEWEAVVSRERTLYALRENLPHIRSRLLLQFLAGRMLPEGTWAAKAEAYRLGFRHGDACALLLIRMEGAFASLERGELELMEYAVTNIAGELLQPGFELWPCREEHDYLVVLVRPAVGGEEARGFMPQLEQTALRIQQKVKLYLRGDVSILMSGVGRFPVELPAMYEQALFAFRQRVGAEQGILAMAGERTGSPAGVLAGLYSPPTLLQLLEAGRWETAEEKLAASLGELSERWSTSLEHLLEAGYHIAGAYTHIAHKNGRQLQEIIGGRFRELAEGQVFRTIARLQEWSLAVLRSLRDESSQEIRASRTSVIRQVQDYIDSHLGQGVSLREISDHVHVHPTHLSKIYKLETGEGISDYIYRIRMERSDYLLLRTDKKIYEIGAELGYPNAHYFIKVFKKRFGLTPQEYRDAHRKAWSAEETATGVH
ncbi:response regulator transcription factor [Paenibacillus sp. S-38]|uniref:response regulator transcription factor n=1 Tax=Paenibacillus sp. S-38 TaxID=3416710 RepID=UPI003CED799C